MQRQALQEAEEERDEVLKHNAELGAILDETQVRLIISDQGY